MGDESPVTRKLKSAGSPGSQPKWMKRQRRLFTNFCNAKLCDRDDVPPITDVFEDLRDGRVLYALLEELSGQSLAALGRIRKPKPGKVETRIDHVSNLSICFRYINQTTKTVGIGPSDIADGKPTMVLGLLWSIIVFFTAKDLGGLDDVSALKKKILKWCQKRTEKNGDVDVRNLKDSFMDGRAFLAILEDVDPEGSPYAPRADACANFARAFGDARAKYGVPELLDAEDAECWKEEQAMVTYLSEMMKRLPERVADVSDAVFKRVDERFAATAADLLDVCRLATVPKDDEARRACAALIAARCGDAGLDVQVLLDGAVVVARTKELHAGKPSVLVASDVAVAAPQGWAASDPFGAARIVDDAVVAPGAKATKAGAVAAVAAVDAVLRGVPNDDQKPELNVELLWTCAHGPGDLDAQLKAALQASADAGRPTPDYVYVDGPGCDALPGAFAAQFSCRGSLRVDVGSSAASPPTNASCVDGNAALCAALAALRDGEGALAIPGLVGFAAKNRFTEALAQHANASQPEAALAGLPRGPPLRGWTLLEHLCFHPGVTVEALRDRGATVHAHLPPGFEPKAAVEALTSKLALTVHAQPGAAKGFLSDVRARGGTTVRPWPLLFSLVSADGSTSDHLSDRSRSASVVFSSGNVEATSHHPCPAQVAPLFLTKVVAAADAQFPGRGAAVAASPAYLPLAAALAAHLPKAATYACGLHAPDAKLGLDGERADLADLKGTVKTLVKMLLAVPGLPKHAKHVDPAPLFAGATNDAGQQP